MLIGAASWPPWVVQVGLRQALREEYLRISTEVALKHIGAKSWLPEELAITCSTMLIIETISWWLAQPEDVYDCQQVARILFQLITSVSATTAPHKT